MTPACTSYLLRRAACQASLLVATAGFKSDDWEDLRQELTLDCLRRSPAFDSSRGDWHGFVRGVIRNHATVLVRRRCRRVQREVLAEDLSWPDPGSEGDQVGLFGDHDKLDIEARLQTSIDVQRVLYGLPAKLQAVALLLSEVSVLEVCEQTGKSRSRVYQMTCQLRDVFVKAGFQRRITSGHVPKSSAAQ